MGSHGRRYDWDYIAELLRDGLSHRKVAERVGCTVRTVERVVAADPTLRVREKELPLTAEEKARVKEMLGDGASYAEIGRTIERSANNLRLRFPGYAWSQEEVRAYALLMRYHSKVLKIDTYRPAVYAGTIPSNN